MLYIIATPIGNLEDITLRALRILKEVDLILAEDTRRTKKLLSHYQIKAPCLSYHQHSKLNKVSYILGLLRQGRNLALVSDAGTPGICDPGNKLISETMKQLNNEAIICIPGPCALTAAASVSGLPCDKFLFLGFPPVKKKRQRFFQEVVKSKHAVIFYESCHRILKTLAELSATPPPVPSSSKRGRVREGVHQVVVCNELTKKFEKIYRGTIDQVINQIKNHEVKPRGEFVVLLARRQSIIKMIALSRSAPFVR